MARLREDFVTSWILAKDLPAIARETADPEVSKFAALAHAEYLYPVDSQVSSRKRERLDHVCASDLFEDPLGKYHKLLGAAGRDQ